MKTVNGLDPVKSAHGTHLDVEPVSKVHPLPSPYFEEGGGGNSNIIQGRGDLELEYSPKATVKRGRPKRAQPLLKLTKFLQNEWGSYVGRFTTYVETSPATNQVVSSFSKRG